MVRLSELIQKPKKLRVFDFDDTLVKTKSYVYVKTKSGEKELTPGEFAIYDKLPGEEFDFRDFNGVVDPEEIKSITNIIRRILEKSSERYLYILTARPTAKPVANYLQDIGIDITRVKVIALKSSNPMDKAIWIKDKVERLGYNDIYFIDDSQKNINAVKGVLKKIPNIKYRVQKY